MLAGTGLAVLVSERRACRIQGDMPPCHVDFVLGLRYLVSHNWLVLREVAAIDADVPFCYVVWLELVMGLSLVCFLLDHVMFLCTNTLISRLLYVRVGPVLSVWNDGASVRMGLQSCKVLVGGITKGVHGHPPTFRQGACTACTIFLRL